MIDTSETCKPYVNPAASTLLAPVVNQILFLVDHLERPADNICEYSAFTRTQ